jgi:carbamate kinase
MRSKIEAAVGFLKAGGGRVVICLPEALSAALEGEAGTTITLGAESSASRAQRGL